MTQCPDCRGCGHYSQRTFCDAPYEHEAIDGCACGGEATQEKCITCKGSGELSALRLATYRARGGAASVPTRRFA